MELLSLHNRDYPEKPLSRAESSKIEVVSHRGGVSDKNPGNNLSTIIELYKQGNTSVEVDAFVTLDNEIILLHPCDKNPWRGPKGFPPDLDITTMTLQNFSEVKITRGVDSFSINTLESLFQFMKETNLRVYIEPKNDPVETIVDAIHDSGVADRCVLLSEKPEILSKAVMYSAVCNKKRPLTNLIVKNPFFKKGDVLRFNEITFGFDQQTYKFNQFWFRPKLEKIIDYIKKSKIRVMAGWVNKTQNVHWALNNDIDGVFTDDPKMVRSVLASYPD